MKVTREDLEQAAWLRFEAALAAFRAREALAAASKPFTAAREDYRKAIQRSELALRTFEQTEAALLLQETGAQSEGRAA